LRLGLPSSSHVAYWPTVDRRAHSWECAVGGVVAVEHRYIDDIIQGAIDDGLSTSGGLTVL
jgi:hypothetical protein